MPRLAMSPRAILVFVALPVMACTAILGSTDVPPAEEAGAEASVRDAGMDTTLHDAGTDATRPRADAAGKDGGHPEASGRDARVDAQGHDATRTDAPTSEGDGARREDAPLVDARGMDARDACRDGGCSTYPATVLADGPLAYWRLDESNATMPAHDQVGSYDGTYHGQVTFNQPGAIASDPDTSVYFNMGLTETGYVAVTGAFETVANFAGDMPFTLEAWMKPVSVDDQYRGVVSYELPLDASEKQGYALYVGGFTLGDGGVGFSRFDNGMEGFARDGSVVLSGSRWFYVVGVYSPSGTGGSGTITLYVDGAEAATNTDPGALQSFACSFDIGATHCGTQGFFQGWIDEVAVYGKALTATQIQAHYKAAQ